MLKGTLFVTKTKLHLDSSSIYIFPLSFITLLIIDFIIIELVLKLGVFAFGKALLRVVMLIALEAQVISFYLFSLSNGKNLKCFTSGAIAWCIWNILFYHMLVEQNTYWMGQKARKFGYLSLGLFSTIILANTVICVMLSLKILPEKVWLKHITNLDLTVMCYLFITEIYIIVKTYLYGQKILKTRSNEMWKKVKFCILVCVLGIILDIVICVENKVDTNFAYAVKPCSFAFKIIFECLCFQFIKAIVVSIDTRTYALSSVVF
jgi:hypothetical protein